MSDDDDHAAVFAAALDSEGDEYLEAEETLRHSTTTTTTTAEIRARTEHDPIARLMAEVLLESSEAEGVKHETAESYLADAERWFAGTVVGTPPVRGVVDNLTALFGASLAGHLALRLVKVPTAPIWRQQVALAYLGRNPSPAVTDAVLQYASATTVPELQISAARVLQSAGDTALAGKVAAERDRLARNGKALAPSLAALA